VTTARRIVRPPAVCLLSLGILVAAAAGAMAADSRSPIAGPVTTGRAAATGPLMLVYFEEPPLIRYAGDVEGLEATSPAARGARRLDARSPASRAYLAYLDGRQADYLDRMGRRLGRTVTPVFRYRAAANGVAVAITRAEGRLVETIPGVVRVVPDHVARLHTDRGPRWIGANEIWDGTATGGLPGTLGEGVVVGIIDSGVNMDHQSFAATGGDGYTHTNPNGAGVYMGWCDPAHPDYSASYGCNDKLIGAWDYTDAYCATSSSCSETDGPEDDNGHGSHTSSTAAGNVLTSPAISGVAPHANLIVYDSCYTASDGGGLCPFSATSAAADQALLDGVDAINYSIGGGSDPWAGDIDTFFLELVGAGTFVAASAGNDGAGTVAHLGPWVATSGASTHDRDTVSNQLVDMTGGTGAPSDMTGASRTAGYGPAPIVYAGDFANGDPDPEQCLNPFPAGTWTSDEIVLCDRGTIARVQKCANVAAGGAGGCVLANVSASADTVEADAHVIPAIHVDLADGNLLRGWLATDPQTHTATLTPAVIATDPALADIMASFSSTGPNLAFDVVKPDVTNPGVDIFAAVNSGADLPPPEFSLMSGTSMSSPHTAGSGALLAALHPDWTPAEIKSALMLTADTTVLRSDGSTPADVTDHGAGRVDLSRAGRAGLTLDETYASFLAANPATGGRPETLNLASLQHTTCVLTCSWTRTFDATTSDPTGPTWTTSFSAPSGVSMSVVPSTFGLGAGSSQSVELTIDATGATVGDTIAAEVRLTPDDGGPVLHLPVWVRVAGHNLPSEVDLVTWQATGAEPVSGLQVAEAITALTTVDYGFAEGTRTDVLLSEDPSPDNPYNNLGDVYVKTVTVPLGARRIVARTRSAEAPDVDLFMGTGATPTKGTEQCASTTATATESCSVEDPAPGTWWILVQNWAGSASQPDLIELVDGLVPGDTDGSLVTSGPPTVPAGQPFDVAVAWSLPDPGAAAGPSRFFFGAFSVAVDGVSPPVDTVFVNLELIPGLIFSDGFELGNVGAWSGASE